MPPLGLPQPLSFYRPPVLETAVSGGKERGALGRHSVTLHLSLLGTRAAEPRAWANPLLLSWKSLSVLGDILGGLGGPGGHSGGGWGTLGGLGDLGDRAAGHLRYQL